MDFNTTIDIIIKDLREAREIIDDLRNYPGVPQLQIELAKSKCRSAEEIIALLKTMKQEYQIRPENEAEEAGKAIKTKSAEPVGKILLIEEDDTPVDDLTAEAAPDEKRPEISFLGTKEKSTKKSEPAPKSKFREKLPETNIVADKFSGISNTFNEQLGNIKGEGDISAVLKSRPVGNLTEAIGINDKFLFIREIFNGDQGSYSEALSKLNKVENLPDARAVIMSYTGVSEENDAVKQLLDLVKRKLPADE